MAVIGVGALVAALEVTAHAVGPNNVLRPSSGIGPAAVFNNPKTAAASTTATTKAGAHGAIGSSVVVIIGQPSASTGTTRPAAPPTTAP